MITYGTQHLSMLLTMGKEFPVIIHRLFNFFVHRITMMVDTESISTDTGLPAILLPGQFTVGGSTENNLQSDMTIRYRGCIRNLIINNQ